MTEIIWMLDKESKEITIFEIKNNNKPQKIEIEKITYMVKLEEKY